MKPAIPYAAIDRGHWPKLVDAAGYELRALRTEDASAFAAALARAGQSPALAHELLQAGPVFGAKHEASGAWHALYAVERWPVLVAGAPKSFGRVRLAIALPEAVAVTEPPLLVRVAWLLFRTHGLKDDLPVILQTAEFEDMLLGRKPGVPGHALDLTVVRTEVLLRHHIAADPERLRCLPDLPVERGPGAAEAFIALQSQVLHGAGGHADRARRTDGQCGQGESFVRRDAAGAPLAAALVRHLPLEPSVKGSSGGCTPRIPAWAHGRTLIQDWLCGEHDYESGLAVVRAVLVAAQAAGSGGIDVLVPDWWPWFHHFQWHGFAVEPIDQVLVARSFDRDLDAAWLRARFHYGLADLGLG